MTMRAAFTPNPFTPKEAADRWLYTEGHVLGLVAKGEIASFKVGKLIRIPFAAVQAHDLAIAKSRSREAAASKAEQDDLYIFGCGDYVKIGRSNDVASRLASLQTGSPHEIVLLGILHGRGSEEKKFHRKFAVHRTSGEWFKTEWEIRQWIKAGFR